MIGGISLGKYMFGIKESSSTLFQAVANELAESNRLKRLELEQMFKTNALRRLYKTVKHKGEDMTIPPSDKDKEEYKLEIEAINKELEDKV